MGVGQETEQLIKEIIEEEKWFNVAFELKPACLKRENGYWKDIEYNFIFKYQNPEKITEEYLKKKAISCVDREIMKSISSNYINENIPEIVLNKFRENIDFKKISETETPEYRVNVEIDFDYLSESNKFEFDAQMKQIQNIFPVKNIKYDITEINK